MRFVLDASIALAWHFEDEGGEAAESVAQQAFEHGMIVPQHWFLEVANGLARGERRKRTSAESTEIFLERLNDFEIGVDVLEVERVNRILLPLAREHRLSVYDAAYLEVARRLEVPLATLDGPLAAAARRMNIELVEGE